MDKPAKKKFQPTKTSSTTEVQAPVGGPNRAIGESVVLDQICHLNEAVTRLSIKAQTTNTLLSSVLQLQQNMFDETVKSNSILAQVKNSLGGIKEILAQSNDKLDFIGKEIDKLEDVTRDMDSISKNHNANVDKFLNALIILLRDEDAIQTIKTRANSQE